MELEQLFERMTEGLSGGRSFGPAFEQDGTLVIPVAYVLGGGGGGSDERLAGPLGATPSPSPSQDEGPAAAKAKPPGKGAGAGFGLISWPIGAYVVKGGSVRWVPTIDFGQLLIVGSLLLRSVAKRVAQRRNR